jgi:hypothetical protein
MNSDRLVCRQTVMGLFVVRKVQIDRSISLFNMRLSIVGMCRSCAVWRNRRQNHPAKEQR